MAVKTTFTCDRCKSEIEPYSDNHYRLTVESARTPQEIPTQIMDFCEKCVLTVMSVVAWDHKPQPMLTDDTVNMEAIK